ncbi:response regulator [Belliella kenyensis]|uniref:histidine kinase n=1 Tax=Belliella kenyensis TaxID=1472724 RepID=A0ABV8EML3_9BACT|nr:response regulator [Belliella kenyensis]MCH7400533.1 response regulator [Belliella kenyensis]MDN3604451.1 response regulator [Belliella kenyensis]
MIQLTKNPTETKILLVEDEIDLQSNLCEILEINRYKVVVADDGVEALKMLELDHFDLIISDIMMPNMDGISLLHQVRLNKNWVNIPFIFLTSKVGSNSMREGMNAGADDYLAKPVQIRDLISAVNAVLTKSKDRNEYLDSQIAKEVKWNKNVRMHEINTPVTGLIGIIELLESSWKSMPEEEVSRILSLAKTSVFKLKSTLFKIQTYQEIMENPILPYCDDCARKENLDQKVFSARDIILKSLDEAFLPHETLSSLETFSFKFNALHLQFILKEIIENAIKFSSTGDSGIEIRIESQMIIIKNTQELFDIPISLLIPEPFKQTGRKEYEKQGLGLGNYIASYLALKNNTKLNFCVDEGLSYVVTLDLTKSVVQ